MSTLLAPVAIQQFKDNNGNSLIGGQLFTYQAGTSIPAPSYTDATGTSANTNPVILNSRGEAPLWLTPGQFYKLILQDASGVLIWSADQVPGGFVDGALLPDTASSNKVRADLSANTGSNLVTFLQSGIGAVGRTVQSKARDVVSAFDFMTTAQISDVRAGTLLVDTTAAIQSAITSLTLGGKVYFPSGNYLVSSALNMAIQGVTLEGENQYTTLITCNNLSSKIINSTANFNQITRLALTYSTGTPLTGATALYSSGSNFSATQFIIRRAFNSMEVTAGTAQYFSQFQLFDYESTGVYAHSVNDVFISQFIINAGTTTRGVLGGIRLADQVEAFNATDGDVLLGVYSMSTGAAVYGIGTRPAYNTFTGVYFDSAANAVLLDKIVQTVFVNCWFSNGRVGAGNPGVFLNQTDTISFTNTRFFNCGSDGCLVSAIARRTVFNSCSFDSNSVTTGVGVSNGLTIIAPSTDFIVKGCIAGNWLFSGKQNYGILVGAGACNGYTICDNDVSNNNNASGIADGGTGLVKYIARNIGFLTQSSGTAAVPVGQTIAVVTHGLAITPAISDISIVATSSVAASGVISFYITALTATTFQIAVNAAVTGTPLNFAWQVRSLGA